MTRPARGTIKSAVNTVTPQSAAVNQPAVRPARHVASTTGAQQVRRTMHSSFYAVIFDLDGVLADSEPWWNEIDAKLLAEYGITYRGEYHRNVLGVSYRLAVEFYKKAFGLSVPTDKMMQRRGEIAVDFFANRVGIFSSTRP